MSLRPKPHLSFEDWFALYRQIPSLREYLLVSQHPVRMDLYTRGDDGRWIFTDFTGLTDTAPMTSVGCALALGEVYDKVEHVGTWGA